MKTRPVSIDVITEQRFKDCGLTEVHDIIGMWSGGQSSQRAGTIVALKVTPESRRQALPINPKFSLNPSSTSP